MFHHHSLEAGHGRSFVLGPLRLDCESTSRGLWVRFSRGDDALLARGESLVWEQRPAAEGAVVVERIFPGLNAPMEITLLPGLADRPIVTRPEIQAALPSGASTEVYFGSPIWLTLAVESKPLVEVPVWRPSDTWFGSNTTSGVLGYAGRTRLRSDRGQLVDSLGRVATRAMIINRESKPVALDRIALPMPAMRTFVDPTGRLWTDSVTVQCTDEREAEVSVEAPTGDDGAPLRMITPARVDADEASVFGAFSAILRGGS